MIATIILLVIQILNLGFTLAKNGEPKKGKYNFLASLIAVVIITVLYYYAGLFDNFK